jgi:hypothetical protein
VAGSPQAQHAPDEHGAVGSSIVGALMQPPSWESDISQELIDDLMLISERMQEFQNAFKDLYRFSTVSALNCPYLLLSSSFFLRLLPNAKQTMANRSKCKLWRTSSNSCRPGNKRLKLK